jgi:hypothetical protein
VRALSSASPEDLAAWRRLVARVGPTTLATWLSPRAVMAATLADTGFATAMLEALRTDGAAAACLTEAFPEVAALAAPMPPQVEHDAGSELPLLDHIATRLLGRKLLGLETRDLHRFQDRGLSAPAFDALATLTARVLAGGLGPALRAAILHLDIAKTHSSAQRAAWGVQGIALDVHNEAAATILRRADRARSWPLPEVLGKLAIAWVETHGLAGQHVRGEGPLVMYAPLVGTLRDLSPALTRTLNAPPGDVIALVLDALHVLDACDTAAVREGLLDDVLLAGLEDIHAWLAERSRAGLAAVERVAREGGNLVPPCIEAVTAYATLGEISDVLRKVFGTYREDGRF